MALALIPAHATARLATVFAVRLMTYAGDEGAAKVKPLATGVTNRELVVAVALGLAPGLLLLNPVTLVAGLIAGTCRGGPFSEPSAPVDRRLHRRHSGRY